MTDSVNSELSRLDHMTGANQLPHTSRYIRGSTHRSNARAIESIAGPLLRGAIGGSGGSGYFQPSDGQMWADAASSISRAMQRYL